MANCNHSPWGSPGCYDYESISVSCIGNPCNAGVCPANATCISKQNTTAYTCECPPNYYGHFCQIGPIANGAVRLNDKYPGLVEIYVNGKWGTICNRGLRVFSSGNVICRAAGKGKFVRIIYNFYSSNIPQMLYSNLQCKGNENSPIECPRTLPSPSECGYRQALVVECTGNY